MLVGTSVPVILGMSGPLILGTERFRREGAGCDTRIHVYFKKPVYKKLSTKIHVILQYIILIDC